MKKTVLIFLLALFLCGCSAQDKITAQVPPEVGQEQLNESEPAAAPEASPIPEPTPVPSDKSVELPIIVTEFEQFLTPLNIEENPDFVTEMETPIESLISPEDDAYYVEFNPDRMSNLQLDRPTMPTYTWYINGGHADKIAEVVIEFDMLETIHPLHPGFFGYDRGYFITLHHLQLIPSSSSWCEPCDDPNYIWGEIDRERMIEIPEFGLDFQKFAVKDGKHVKITIPYSEFQSTAKDLTLQFMPGTTFANLTVNLWGADTLDTDIYDEISKPVELPERDLMHDVILPTLQVSEDDISHCTLTDSSEMMSAVIFANEVMAKGLIMNPDNSISMPVSLYDLGEYADEVQGKYAVIPEGLVPAFMILSSNSYQCRVYNNDRQQMEKDKRKLADFVFENMIDETGQIYGVYDLAQGKLVASDRKSPVLPVLSAMTSSLSDNEVDFLVNSIIANDIIRVGDTLYYAPYGISGDGTMLLKLSDFALSPELFDVIMTYSTDRSRLDEEYGCAMLLEGFLNSLKLILESQERNMTRLPSSELSVIFKDGGNSYELKPSDTFDIDDTFFALGFKTIPMGMFGFGSGDNPWGYAGAFATFKFEITRGACADKLSGGKDGVYSESQKRYIRECEVQYSEEYNSYTIQTLYYECWLNIFNFLQAQPSETAYAPKYNVHSGEMIEASAEALYPEFSHFAPMIKRFGTPNTPLSYHFLVGLFSNDNAIRETASLVMANYEMYVHMMFDSQSFDYSDPDLFADNGFNVWGYDSLQYEFGRMTSDNGALDPDPYTKIGLNFNREDWKEYTMRKLNEKVRNEVEQVSIDDEFPLFYDHIPEVEIIS